MSEIKVDTVAEKTSANGVTIDGLSIKDSKLVTANSVVETNLTNDIVTLAKMAAGTDGNIISYDASGNPVAIATGNDGQVLTSTGAGSPPAFEALPGGGKILQVVNASKTQQTATTSQSFVDVGVSVAITPSASNSKILVLSHFNECYIPVADSTRSMILAVLAGSSVIHETHTLYFTALGGEQMFNQDFIQVHSPNTTSEVTYKMQFKSHTGHEVRVQQNGPAGGSTLTLLEIGA